MAKTGPPNRLPRKIDRSQDAGHFQAIMAAGVNVRFAGELQGFIQQRVLKSGLYNSAGEYIRDLVRRDYEHEEQRKKLWLRHELAAGAEAEVSEFFALDAGSLIAKAKARKKAKGR